MTFDEFYSKELLKNIYPYGNIKETFKLYPSFEAWITYEYMNYNILFDPVTFAKKLMAVITNKVIEIDRIEKIISFILNKEITEDDLGNVITSTSTNTANSTGKSSDSYSGYNVDNGEFSNTSNTAETTNKGNTSTTSINRVGQLYNMANYELRNLFNNINNDIIKLFQTIY